MDNALKIKKGLRALARKVAIYSLYSFFYFLGRCLYLLFFQDIALKKTRRKKKRDVTISEFAPLEQIISLAPITLNNVGYNVLGSISKSISKIFTIIFTKF